MGSSSWEWASKMQGEIRSTGSLRKYNVPLETRFVIIVPLSHLIASKKHLIHETWRLWCHTTSWDHTIPSLLIKTGLPMRCMSIPWWRMGFYSSKCQHNIAKPQSWFLSFFKYKSCHGDLAAALRLGSSIFLRITACWFSALGYIYYTLA